MSSNALAPPPKGTIAANSATLLAAQFGYAAGYFVAVLLLARWLGPDGRGAVAFATLSILMISRLARLGVPEAASVHVASRPEMRSVTLANQLLFALTVPAAFAGVFIGALLATGARPAGITAIIMGSVLVGTVANAIYETTGAFLVACGRTRTAATTSLIQPWGLVIGLVAAHASTRLTPSVAVVCWTAPLVLQCIRQVFYAWRDSGIARPDFDEIRVSLRFGFPAWVGGISTFVNYRLDQVLMGFISTASQLGLYAVGVNASEILLYVSNTTSTALTPAVAQTDPALIAARTLRALRGVLAITLPTTLLGLVAGPFLIPLVFGQRYEGSVVPFLILAVGSIGWAVSAILSSALLGARASRRSSVGSVVAMIVGLVLDIVLIPPHGATGAAIATTVGFFAAGIAAALAFRSLVRTPLREFVPGYADIRLMLDLTGAALVLVTRWRR